MSIIAQALHFGFNEMLEMDVEDFEFFVEEAQEILDRS